MEADSRFSLLKIGVAANNREDLFRQLIEELRRAGSMQESERPVQALLEREAVQTTALGGGIALPHARTRSLTELLVTAARLDQPVDFDAPDGKPVDLVFMILGPVEDPDEHVRMLGRLARMISRPGVVDALRSAPDETAFEQVLLEGIPRNDS